MGNSGKAVTLAIIVAVLIGLLFFSGSIMAAIQEWIGRFQGGDGGTSGYSGVCFRVNWKDGTFKWGNASMTFSILPLTIVYEGKEIQSIDIYVVAKLTGTSGITAWSTSTSQQLELYKTLPADPVPKTSSTGIYPASGTTWAEGAKQTLAYTNILGSTLDNLVETYGEGNWLMQINANVNLTATINGVPTAFTSSAPSGGINFANYYLHGTPTLSITVPSTPITKLP